MLMLALAGNALARLPPPTPAQAEAQAAKKKAAADAAAQPRQGSAAGLDGRR
jgi:hypothetical protein